MTKKENGVFVKRQRKDHHEIYNESADESDEANSEDERMTATLRDIVAKNTVTKEQEKFKIPSDIDSEFEEVTLPDEHAPIGDSVILPDEYAAGAAPNDSRTGEGDTDDSESIDTNGLSRKSCGIMARKFGREQEPIHADKGSTVYKERVTVQLDNPPGNPIIEPPLQFGHALNREHRQRLNNQSCSERRIDSRRQQYRHERIGPGESTRNHEQEHISRPGRSRR